MKVVAAIFILFSLNIIVALKKNEEKEGPFRTYLMNVTQCANTTFPKAKDPPILLHVETQTSGPKNQLIKGKFTVLRETKEVKFKVKSYSWANEKWQRLYLINDVFRCRGLMVELLGKALGGDFLYDKKTCVFHKGEFIIKDLDLNLMQHLWMNSMRYGRMLWRAEITAGRATFSCLEYETAIERA